MKTLEELKTIRDKNKNKLALRKEHNGYRILVCMDTCGIKSGAKPVMSSFVKEIQTRNLQDVVVIQTDCINMCELEPIVEVIQPNNEKIVYVKMTSDKAKRVIEEHIINGNIVLEYTKYN